MTSQRGFMPCVLLLAGGIAAGAAQAQTASNQPEFKTMKADFVPGDRTLFYDDFADMTANDPPAHFKVRGAAPELREAGAVRQLTATANTILTPNLKGLPPNFTFETDVTFDVPNGRARLHVLFLNKEREALTWVFAITSDGRAETVLSQKVPKYQEFGRKPVRLPAAGALRLALWIQDGRLRVFVNGEKQLDFNQVEVAPIDRVEIQPMVLGKGPSVGLRMVRIAESVPDLGKTILASGRYVSHGILFDTNSDRIKPESAASIQAVASALGAHPALKLRIEGHTDAVGNAAANLDLSRRRAEAVKAVLVSQFDIDAARLTTDGLGATKPIGPNDTAVGRAQNRRVEFVRH